MNYKLDITRDRVLKAYNECKNDATKLLTDLFGKEFFIGDLDAIVRRGTIVDIVEKGSENADNPIYNRYIVAQSDNNTFCLINLKDGNRFCNPVTFDEHPHPNMFYLKLLLDEYLLTSKPEYYFNVLDREEEI